MANIRVEQNGKRDNFAWLRRISLTRLLMYTILLAYAFASLLPFLAMISTSLMTLGEVNGGRLVPQNIDFANDISGCILYTTDTFVNPTGDRVTETRLLIDIPDEAASVQNYGFFSSRDESLIREEHFRLPFFTNYCAAWDSGNLGKFMINTVWIVLISVFGTLIFSTMAAYAFARMEFAGKNLVFALMLTTLMIPSIVINLPNFLMINEMDSLLRGTFLCAETAREGRCLLNNWPALTVPFMANAISIFLLRQHFATIPSELWDAARMDGAGHIRFLVQVLAPLSRAALFVVLLFAFIGAWNELPWAILVTNDDQWRPISVGLQRFLVAEGNFAHLRMAGATIAILPVLALYALTQRQFIEGLSSSAVKG